MSNSQCPEYASHCPHSSARPVMSAGTASEVDAADGCALPPEACSFASALPENTPMPGAPSPTPPPAAMLVTTGMLPLLLVDDDA